MHGVSLERCQEWWSKRNSKERIFYLPQEMPILPHCRSRIENVWGTNSPDTSHHLQHLISSTSDSRHHLSSIKANVPSMPLADVVNACIRFGAYISTYHQPSSFHKARNRSSIWVTRGKSPSFLSWCILCPRPRAYSSSAVSVDSDGGFTTRTEIAHTLPISVSI